MRMPPEGTPFVPPNPICPAEQEGTISDVRAVLFRLTLDPGPNEPTGIWGTFVTLDEEGVNNFVEVTEWELPPDSPVIQQLYDLLPAGGDHSGFLVTDHTKSPFVEEVRLRFCERIANCQGVVNGECWALGASAVQEVIEEVLRENP